MKKAGFRGTVLTAILFMFLMGMTYQSVLARDDGRHNNGNHGRSGREVIYVGHNKYHYRDGRFYRPSWFGLEFVVSAPPIGAVVAVLPYGHQTRAYRGTTYYYYNNIYYKNCPGGYVVVPVPVATSTSTSVATQSQGIYYGQTVVVNVPNKNGTYTAVTLHKQNGGYIGPQGEYYDGNPSVEQLRALYGK
ncbi:MAG: DUF6515 family protein [Candidatus Omnitrophota bacterium]|jgi:hypothetical protein